MVIVQLQKKDSAGSETFAGACNYGYSLTVSTRRILRHWNAQGGFSSFKG